MDDQLFNFAVQLTGNSPPVVAMLMRDPSYGPLLRQQYNARPYSHPSSSVLSISDVWSILSQAKMQSGLESIGSLGRLGIIATESNEHRQGRIDEMEARRRELLRKQGKQEPEVSLSGITKHFSTKSIADLQRVGLSELSPPEWHEGAYVLARIVSRPVKTIEVSFMVEDPSGHVEKLDLYNFPLPGVETGPDLDALFPLGQHLVVREPTFKGDYLRHAARLRVDSPTDIVFLEPNNLLLAEIEWSFPAPAESLPSFFDFKQHGNSLFKQKTYLSAVKAWSKGLIAATSDEQKLLLHLNRSQAHLFLHNFASAYHDTSTVLSLLDEDVSTPPKTKLKTLVRQGHAFEGLRKLNLALQAYEAVLEVDSSSTEGKNGRKRVSKMLRESKTEDFDWRDLQEKRNQLEDDDETGDFFGPIAIVELEGRGGGRGIVATRAIEAGELILVEKAFATGRPDKNRPRHHLHLDIRRSCIDDAGDVALTAAIISRLLDDPSVAPAVHALYGGAEFPSSLMATVNFLAQRDISIGGERVDIDVAKIEEIVKRSPFDVASSNKDPWEISSGLYPTASLFNHHDEENCFWKVQRDIISVRARRAIKKGEELSVSYVQLQIDPRVRDEVIRLHFKQVCEYDFCTNDRLDGHANLAKRRQLVGGRWPALVREKNSMCQHSEQSRFEALKPKLASYVEELEQTYLPSHSQFKPDLVVPYYALADLEYIQQPLQPRQANALSLKSLLAAGAVFDIDESRIKVLAAPLTREDGVAIVLEMACRLMQRSQRSLLEEAKRWVGAAMQIARIYDGDSRSRFLERYAAKISELGLEMLVRMVIRE